MNQTGYLPVQPFSRRLKYDGGFCKWWFTPWQNIAAWPEIDPLSQYLGGEPALFEGTSWLGPIIVPNSQLGFEESQQASKAGLYYKQSVSGYYPGDSGSSRVNLENLVYNQVAIVGKMRAGGLYLLLGNEENGLSFSHKYKSDEGAKGTAGSEFSFLYQSLYKGLVLSTFQGNNTVPPPDGSSGGPGPGDGSGQTNTNIIPFNNVDHVDIEWTVQDLNNFGAFPLIEVWIDDTATGGQRALANVPIYVDAFPPDTTSFTVDLTGNASGIIVIK